jgi:hypothetical protein
LRNLAPRRYDAAASIAKRESSEKMEPSSIRMGQRSERGFVYSPIRLMLRLCKPA